MLQGPKQFVMSEKLHNGIPNHGFHQFTYLGSEANWAVV